MDLSSIKDVLSMYSEFQRAHPHLGTMLASEAIYVAADAASQLTLEKRLNTRKLAYTAALAPIYGLLTEALIESGEMVGRTVSQNPFVKSALGPNLWGNLTNLIFFYNNTIGEETNYSIPALMKSYASMFSNGFFSGIKKNFLSKVPGKEYKKATIGTLTGWNIAQGLSYCYVPPQLRATVAMGIGTLWVWMMTAWSYIGAKKLRAAPFKKCA
jgi:hypothetical protein